jgi:threonine synthase
MGLPLHHFIAATNRNDAAVRYIQTGEYTPRATIPTLSTAMDVGDPSNFARVLELFDHDPVRLRRVLRAYRVTDEETIQTNRQVYARHGYLLSPHSAVAWTVAARHGHPRRQPLIVATASPLKFAGELAAATGILVDDSEAIQRLRSRPERKQTIPNTLQALKPILVTAAHPHPGHP